MIIEYLRAKSYFISYIYLYMVLMPWNFFNGQMGALSVILLIWWLVIGKKRGYFLRLVNIFKFKPLLLIILFFLYSYLSLFWTDNFESAKDNLKYYKYYWIMIPVLFTSLKREQAERGIYLFLLSLGGYAVFSILIYLDFIDIFGSGQGNTRGILAYAIVTPYMAIGVLFSMVMLFFSAKKSFKIVFLLMTVLFFIGLLVNNGRAGQLAFFATVGVLLIVIRSHLSIRYVLSIALLLLLTIFSLYNFGKLDRHMAGFSELTKLEQSKFSGSWGHRAYMWYAAADIIKKNPIFGVGVGDNIDELIEYTKTHPSKATWLRSFHNQHLDILTKYGVIGYAIFLWGMILLLLHLRNDKKTFFLSVVFVSVVFFDGFGDIILLMKPFNNVFILLFTLFSILAYSIKIDSTKLYEKLKKESELSVS